MQSCTAPELLSTAKNGPTMPTKTATDMLHAIKTEYGLDRVSARAFVASSLDAAPRPRRRLQAWVHTVMTFSF